ncbi:MAG: hypothetical protein V4467_01910 [Patescibacteria group bacterium]
MKLRIKVQVGPTRIDTFSRMADMLLGYSDNIPPSIEVGNEGEIVVTVQSQYEPGDGSVFFTEKGHVAGAIAGFLFGTGVQVFGRSVEEIV